MQSLLKLIHPNILLFNSPLTQNSFLESDFLTRTSSSA